MLFPLGALGFTIINSDLNWFQKKKLFKASWHPFKCKTFKLCVFFATLSTETAFKRCYYIYYKIATFSYSHHYFSSKWACLQRLEDFQLSCPRKMISLLYAIAGRKALLSSSRQGRMLWCSKTKLATFSPPISHKDCTKTSHFSLPLVTSLE